MSLSLTNFVNININYYTSVAANGTRDTAVLIDYSASDEFAVGKDKVYSTFKALDDERAVAATSTDVQKMAKVFFENGGQKLHLIKVDTSVEGSFITAVKALPDEEIMIASTCSNNTLAVFASQMLSAGTFVGIKEKILVTNITDLSTELTSVIDNDAITNMAVKYGTKSIEMTVLAAFTKVNTYRGQISDYCFTAENIESFTASNVIVSDDTLFAELKDANVLFEIDLPSYGVCSYGENKTCGISLMNDFIKIILTQTLTQRLVALLASKLRYDEKGISLVSGVISSEMEKYVKYGYLAVNKEWDKADLYDDSGKYLIISEGTPLLRGYTFKILPFSSLTDEEKLAHKLPDIYLVIADSYAITSISITGTIL